MSLIKKIKQNVMLVLGIGVAIGLSAWSLTSEGMDSREAKSTAKQVEPALYWYPVTSGNTLGAQLNSTPQTKSESMPSGSKQITNCEDTTDELCIVGFETPQSPGSSAPSNPSEDHRIDQSAD